MPAVRLFGPLRVEVDERRLGPRDFGGLKPKQVLELLLVHCGRAVPKDEIAELVGGSPGLETSAALGTGQTVIADLIDADDRVVLRNRTRIHGRRSGTEDEVVFSQVATFRSGKIVMLEYFLDHNEALAAVGLRE